MAPRPPFPTLPSRPSPIRRGIPLLLTLLLAFSPLVRGAVGEEIISATSWSGQFIVSGPRNPTPPSANRIPSPSLPSPPVLHSRSPNPVRLTPQTLAISCERVKAEILRLLDQRDSWRQGGGVSGKILIGIAADISTNAPFTVQLSPFERGWHFRLPLPAHAEEDRVVRALTQAIVSELASRHGNARAGDPPLWLVEGLTQSVLAAFPDGVIAEPHSRTVIDLRPAETTARLRETLASRPPLAFHQLSQPDLDRMDEDAWRLFGASAQVALRELSRLPDGPRRLSQWLDSMQDYWNWQSGFIDAFQPTFRSLLDVEKWWAIAVVNFTGRSQAMVWPPDFALRKLDEALHPVGLLPAAGNRATRLALEDILQSWDHARQIPVLRQVLRQLQAILIGAPPPVRTLLYEYADVLDDYLDARNHAGFEPVRRGQPIPRTRLIARDAIGRLRELDGRRAALELELQPAPAPSPLSSRPVP